MLKIVSKRQQIRNINLLDIVEKSKNVVEKVKKVYMLHKITLLKKWKGNIGRFQKKSIQKKIYNKS